jgi:hypothetical protein
MLNGLIFCMIKGAETRGGPLNSSVAGTLNFWKMLERMLQSL